MNWVRAIAVALLLFLYLRSPIDLVPDRLGIIGLLDDVVVLVVGWWWLREQFRRPRAPRGSSAPGGGDTERREQQRWDPYAVLGVPVGASRADITHAYREQMKRYHPDRVAGLGSELRRVAHQRSVEIQRAYEELSAR